MADEAKGFIFKRVEKKYMLSPEQYKKVIEAISPHMEIDQYGLSKICNIYFDTEDDLLVRTSNEKPIYKEKLRLRSYGVPSPDNKVFIELKKKFEGIVYKRRITMKLKDAKNYLYYGIRPSEYDSQIMREIDYFLEHYHPVPKLYLAYDRTAWFGKKDPDFRITFDSRIRSRRQDLFLEHGDLGQQLIEDEYYLMEVKSAGNYPMWLVNVMSEENIYPTTFSKYGTIYAKEIQEKYREQLSRFEIKECAATIE